MSVKSTVNALMDIAGLRKTLESAHDRRAELVEKLKTIQTQIKRLQSLPLTRADLEAALLRDIAEQQRLALIDEDFIGVLKYAQSRGIREQLAGTSPTTSPFDDSQYNKAIQSRLLAIIGDPAKILSRLKPAIDKIDFRDAGPALADRKSQIAELEKQVAALTTEISDLTELLDVDVRKNYTPQGPQIGDRKLIDGSWATWESILPGSHPGWNFDPTPHSGPAAEPITRY